MTTDLPYIDEYSQTIGASPERIWAALLRILGASRAGTATLVRVLRCDPSARTPEFGSAESQSIPGFRIVAIEPGKRLSLEGRHRFSSYRLTFELAGNCLLARTHAAFPGLLGRIYRTAVIGSGAHALVARRLLRKVADAAQRAGPRRAGASGTPVGTQGRILLTAVAGGVSGLLVLGVGGRALMRALALLTPELPRFTWGGTLQILGLGALWGLATGPLVLALPPRVRESRLGGAVLGLASFTLGAVPFLIYSGFSGSLVAPAAFLRLGGASFPLLFAAWGALFLLLRRRWCVRG